MKNKIVAAMFEKIADVLEFQGEIPFKVNAYRKAARVIGEMQEDIEDVWREGRLREIPGVGTALATKIEEYLTTGKMTKYEDVVSSVSADLIELLEIQNLGPKTAALANKKLGVENLNDLKRVIADGSLAKLPGMGEKKVENIQKGIELYERARARISIGVALPLVEELIAELKSRTQVKKIEAAGSTRRMRETVGDIDILVETDRGAEVIQAFVHLPNVTRILAAGDTKGSVIVGDRIQVDLRAVGKESYGAALQYFTGSKAHNVHLRGIARKNGLKINEYGVFRGEEKIGGEKEADIYHVLDLVWIPPEMREDRGEIELAAQNRLPHLIELKHIKGDLHVHSHWSDGKATIAALAIEARQRDYRYIAVCDHSKSAKYAHGLEEEQVLEKIEEIKQIQENVPDIKILSGAEVDILADGSLDYPDEILAQLDIVVAAIHQGFKQRATERMLAAMENPYVFILAHPTGRLISRREGYRLELEKVFQKAAETGTILEINSYYDRLDLSDVNARRAKEMGIKLSINSDTHELAQLDAMKLGVGVARRAWLEPEDVINTYSLEKLLKLRDEKRKGR
ncbi:MAG TPA: DNA polymerase/3'-5' exonuclease PolX [Bacteroidetes bacterium]|nr:DNA polymerase/3'-5' exonuclease PolX [Bacteroidota bacterium]